MAGIKEIIRKELADHLGGKRFVILFFLIYFLCLGVAWTILPDVFGDIKRVGEKTLFLKIFVSTPEELGISLLQFFTMFGPIIGLVFTFDSINREASEGTLYMSLSQPVHRDSFINGKFLAAVLTISVFLVASVFSILGLTFHNFRLPIPLGELSRVVAFLGVSIIYISFWAGVGLLFSVLLDKPSTSALASVAVWLSFTVFFYMFGGVLGQEFGLARTTLLKFSPPFLYGQASLLLLEPKLRFTSLANLSAQELRGMVAEPLAISETLYIIWPQIVGIIAAMMIIFLASYFLFMKKEIRPS